MTMISIDEDGKYLRQFADPGELLERADFVLRHSDYNNCLGRMECSSLTGSYSFTGTRNLEEAVELARYGWFEGLSKIEKLKATVQELAPVSSRLLPTYDTSGDEPDIDMYLSGIPEHMVTLTEHFVHSRGKVIRLAVNKETQGNVPLLKVEWYGLAILLTVETLLSLGYSVELTLVFPFGGRMGQSTGKHYEINVTILSAGSPINLDTLAFWLVHPSVLRRIIFASEECESDKIRRDFGFARGQGYGSCHAKPQFLGEIDLLIPADYGSLRSNESIVPLTTSWLEKLGIKAEEEV